MSTLHLLAYFGSLSIRLLRSQLLTVLITAAIRVTQPNGKPPTWGLVFFAFHGELQVRWNYAINQHMFPWQQKTGVTVTEWWTTVWLSALTTPAIRQCLTGRVLKWVSAKLVKKTLSKAAVIMSTGNIYLWSTNSIFISSGSVGAGTPSKFQTNKCAGSGHALLQFFFTCSHQVWFPWML
jgi:hypothetical protein